MTRKVVRSIFLFLSSMAVSSRVWIGAALLLVSLHAVISTEENAEVSSTHVVTLDASNFEDVVSKHPFIAVEFYAPWCGHCKKLAPEYEKAAATLSNHDPPIVLAKVDANEESNKALASKYEVKGFPTIKILRNGGENIQEYNGPREADGIVEYLKKQSGPPSVEIKSAEDAAKLNSDEKIFIVGVFAKFSGEEFDNFITLAEKLRLDYDFGHTMEAKFLPKGESVVNQPTVRILKPFDELFVDSNDFHVDALDRFIEEGTVPLVTIFTKDPSCHPFVMKFFNKAKKAKVMLFANFSSESIEEFKLKYHDVAVKYNGNKIGFLLGDSDTKSSIIQYFGLREDMLPLIFIQTIDGKKYLNANLAPLQIADWMKDYMDDKLTPFIKSEPIPEVNDEPVKVVVAHSLNDVVYASGKNVFFEFYAPWCGHCKKLAPILDEVAVSLESDPNVIIAKMDATANDVPGEFDVRGYPTVYFLSSTGKKVLYNGERTKDGIIDFIQKNKDTALESQSDSAETDTLKDEL